MRRATGFVLAGVALGALAGTAHASLSITAFNTAFGDDFNSFGGLGFSPTPGAGQLDSNTWRVEGLSDDPTFAFGDTGTSGDFARGASSGGVTTGGVYAFEVAGGDFALGVQPGGSDFTPGTFTLRIQNDTGATITQLDVSYDVYVFNDQPRGNTFNFAWSDDDMTYNPVAALDLTSPEAADANPMWVQNGRMTSITGISIADGGVFYLQWQGDDATGSGSRDEFGLDNVSITAVPSPAGLAVLALAGLGLRRRRRA